ncbi:transmembrane protein, putative (macronuclear) [Tetrahymena thermophila SB210]|uniref:Transmembrane protein, putative n=1 Tax=Tetrahymena thermophila (strain SB210) TaxID=312017 RepID=Q245T4_TETTS|nr:transmembrane protein, putative [Tetrahymena thermophila SB210]EAS03549.3 transmembrane protein, putative [Tetrahymena thermophila SB210]|eukprot:XP_001023794.3 transmembrane protein, putative [Tetrahymena thermophila SB210]
MPSITKKILSNCDVLGSPIGLNFQKRNIYRTPFGAFISIVFAVFMGLFFWNTITQFLSKDVVKVAMSKTYSTNPSQIQISPTGLMFAVKVDSPDFINRPIFNITFERRDYVNHPDGSLDRNRYPMYLEPCTLDHWTQLPSYNINWTDQFIKANLSSYLCPRKDDIIEIEGIFSSEHFKHIKIGITDCKNNTPLNNPWRPVCASPQFIKSYFDANKNVRVVMQVVNYIINPPDPVNYITSFLDNQLFFTVNPQSYQTADIYFNQYEFITDNSIMPYKQIETKKLPVLENGNFRAQQFLYTQTSYGDFFFRRDPVTYTLNRQFQKISEVISYIGGFSQIFLSISAVLVCFYNDYIYSVKLANKLYNFEVQAKDNQNTILQQQHISQNMYTHESSPTIKKGINSKNNNQHQEQINLMAYQKQQFENTRQSFQIIQKSNNSIKDNNCIIESQKYIDELNNKNFKQSSTQKNDNLQLNQYDNSSRYLSCQVENHDEKLNENKLIQFKEDTDSQRDNQHQEPIQNANILNLEQSQGSYIPDEGNQAYVQIQFDKSQAFIKELNLKNLSEFKQQNQLNQSDYKQKNLKNVNLEEQQLGINEQANKNVKQYTQHIISPASEQNIQILLHSEINTERIKFEPEIENMIIEDGTNNIYKKVNSKQDQNKPGFSIQNNQQNTYLTVENNTFKQTPFKSDNNLRKPQLFDQYILPAQKSYSSQKILNKQVEINTSKNYVKQKIENSQAFTDRQTYLKNKFSQILKREENLDMTYKFFIYKLTCKKFCKTKQVMLVEKAHKLIRKDLDVSVILYKLKELEKFKKLFLNEQQEVLFNFFPKPIISSDVQKELPSRLNIQESQKDEKKYLKNFINNIKKSNFNKKVQKTFNINERVATKVSFALQKLKKPIKNANQIFQYDQMSAYQTLYQAYIAILHKKEITEFDKKLIFLLGQEMNGIFEESEKQIINYFSFFRLILFKQLKNHRKTNNNIKQQIVASKCSRQLIYQK